MKQRVKKGKEVKRKNGYKMLQRLLPFSNGLCPLCSLPLDLEGIKAYINWQKNRKKGGIVKVRRQNIDVNIDHIVPFELTGNNDISNLQLTHVKCNSDKSKRLGIRRSNFFIK